MANYRDENMLIFKRALINAGFDEKYAERAVLKAESRTARAERDDESGRTVLAEFAKMKTDLAAIVVAYDKGKKFGYAVLCIVGAKWSYDLAAVTEVGSVAHTVLEGLVK